MLVTPDCIQHTPQEAAQKDSHQQKTYAANGNIPHPCCSVFDSCFLGALQHLRVHSMQKPGQTGCGYMSQEDLQIYTSMFNRQAMQRGLPVPFCGQTQLSKQLLRQVLKVLHRAMQPATQPRYIRRKNVGFCCGDSQARLAHLGLSSTHEVEAKDDLCSCVRRQRLPLNSIDVCSHSFGINANR